MTAKMDIQPDAAFAAVRSVMARVFGVDEQAITAWTTPADIERWDSLNMVVVSIGIERRLDRSIAPDCYLGATSVGHLVEMICRAV